MHLVEILLPLRGNDGTPLPAKEFTRVRDILTRRFGGLTAFTRAPAEGVWKAPANDEVSHDDIAVIEVMADSIDAEWWERFRGELEMRLGQEQIVIRSHQIRRL